MSHASVFLRIYLIRHGQSANNVLAATSATAYNQRRTADAPLTELGKKQAEATGLFLKSTMNSQSVRLTQIYSSAMARALATSCHIAAPLGLSPRCWPDICEIGGIHDNVYGPDGVTVIGTKGVPGLSRTGVQEAFPAVRLPEDDSITEAGWWKHEIKETEEMGVERVRKVLRELVAAALALQNFDGTNEKELEEDFDLRAHLRKKKEPRNVSVGEGEAPSPVPEGFDSPGSVADAAKRFHSPIDTRQSGGDPSSVRAAMKYTKDGRPKISGTRGTKIGLTDSSEPGPRSIAVALVAHGDFIETMLRVISNLDATTAFEMATRHEGKEKHEHEHGGSSAAALASAISPSSSASTLSTTSAALLHHNPLAAAQFCHHNAGLTAFDVFADGNIRLLRVNDYSHLLYHRLYRKEEGEAEGEGAKDISSFFDTSLITGGPGL
jgi:broad specificity phosphatase PhoE